MVAIKEFEVVTPATLHVDVRWILIFCVSCVFIVVSFAMVACVMKRRDGGDSIVQNSVTVLLDATNLCQESSATESWMQSHL